MHSYERAHSWDLCAKIINKSIQRLMRSCMPLTYMWIYWAFVCGIFFALPVYWMNLCDTLCRWLWKKPLCFFVEHPTIQKLLLLFTCSSFFIVMINNLFSLSFFLPLFAVVVHWNNNITSKKDIQWEKEIFYFKTKSTQTKTKNFSEEIHLYARYLKSLRPLVNWKMRKQ